MGLLLLFDPVLPFDADRIAFFKKEDISFFGSIGGWQIVKMWSLQKYFQIFKEIIKKLLTNLNFRGILKLALGIVEC